MGATMRAPAGTGPAAGPRSSVASASGTASNASMVSEAVSSSCGPSSAGPRASLRSPPASNCHSAIRLLLPLRPRGRSLRPRRLLLPPAGALPIPPPHEWPRLVVVARYLRAACPDQEVQVSAPICLQNVLVIQPRVAPGRRGLFRRPAGPAAGKLVVGHIERQRPAGRIELDPVPAADERQR